MMNHHQAPKYYYQPENRLIECDELCRKYGTDRPLTQLGIYPLSVQPDYIPVSFTDNGDGTFYPVESYTSMRNKAIDALVAAGHTPAEAEALLD